MIQIDLLLIFDNKCVSTCSPNNELNDSNIFDCSGFYYIDKETQYKNCISENLIFNFSFWHSRMC